jgi:T5SS/PEP-CTERM-associated repeat protein
MKRLPVSWLVSMVLALTPLAHGEKIWTNAASGLWRDGTNWTGHIAPNITSFIRITNDNTKTVTIDALTPSTNLTVQSLTLSAPPGATNTLLLSDVGTNNPLTFQTGLELQDGAALRVTNSGILLQLTNDHVNIDGSVTLDSGFIDFGDTTVTTRVGRATSGVLYINSGTVSAGALTVGGLTNSTGAVNMTGGLLSISSLLSIGRNQSTTGIFSMSGGQVSVLDDDTRVGDEGVGSMMISNATATFTNLQVGRDLTASGTLTLQPGGVIRVLSDFPIARFNGSTGTVTVAGGQLLASGLTIYVARGGSGRMTLFSGIAQADTVLVAADTTNSIGATGTLSVSGGSLAVASSFWVGSLSFATGQVFVTGGTISVTNEHGAGISTVPSGSINLSRGALITDVLLLTNAAGQFNFSGGILETKGTTVANGAPFIIGDGSAPARFHLNGGTHSFANGLIISSNATLDGCGTVLGNIINHGTIATNCSGSTLPPSIVGQPASQAMVAGRSLTLSVTASGTLPLSYQWRLGGADISGATTSVYSKSNLQVADAGNYTVVITNAAGAITSAVAVVTVTVPPSVTTPPQNQTVTPGGSVTFTVVAAGTQPLSYQWQFGGVNIPGATTTSYTKATVQAADAGNYTVVVTNIAGSVTSPTASLQILTGVTIAFAARTGTTNAISVQSINGTSYTLEFKDTLDQTNWTPVLPSSAGSGNLLLLRDNSATVPVRFYRVRAQ